MRKKGGLLAVLLIASASAMGTSSLPFIDDDYAKALATAKQRNLPMFVEVSAPW